MLSELAGDKFFGLDVRALLNFAKTLRKQISARILLVEFRSSSLILAELKISRRYVQVDHIREYTLPSEALERSIPCEPEKMGRLIHDFCIEESIPASRAVVFVDDDTIYSSQVSIEQPMTNEEALDYIYTPDCSCQIPIQASQYDITLTATDPYDAKSHQRTFFYNAIPKKFTDAILQTFASANLEIDSIRPSRSKQIALSCEYISQLAEGEYALLLDLRSDYTMAIVHTRYSMIHASKLTAIRSAGADLPEARKNTLDEVDSGDRQTKNNSHPLTDLDVKQIGREITELVSTIKLNKALPLPKLTILSGPNSLHCNIQELLASTLNLDVRVADSLGLPFQILYTKDYNTIPSNIVASLTGAIACCHGRLYPRNQPSEDPSSPSQSKIEYSQSLNNTPDTGLPIDSNDESDFPELIIRKYRSQADCSTQASSPIGTLVSPSTYSQNQEELDNIIETARQIGTTGDMTGHISHQSLDTADCTDSIHDARMVSYRECDGSSPQPAMLHQDQAKIAKSTLKTQKTSLISADSEEYIVYSDSTLSSFNRIGAQCSPVDKLKDIGRNNIFEKDYDTSSDNLSASQSNNLETAEVNALFSQASQRDMLEFDNEILSLPQAEYTTSREEAPNKSPDFYNNVNYDYKQAISAENLMDDFNRKTGKD